LSESAKREFEWRAKGIIWARRAAIFSTFDASKQVKIIKRRPLRPSDEEAARNSANVSAFNQHFRHTSQIIILVCYCNKHPQRHDCQLRPSPPQLSSIPRATSCRASTPLPTTFSQPGLSQPAILPTHFGPPPPLDLLAAGPHLIPGPPLPAEPLATRSSYHHKPSHLRPSSSAGPSSPPGLHLHIELLTAPLLHPSTYSLPVLISPSSLLSPPTPFNPTLLSSRTLSPPALLSCGVILSARPSSPH